jgi:hypothetical protein
MDFSRVSLVDNFTRQGGGGCVWSGKRMSVELPIRRRSSSFSATGWRKPGSRERNNPSGERNVPFYQTNPPIFEGFSVARFTAQIIYGEKRVKNSVGSFSKTNPPGGVLLRAGGGFLVSSSAETKPPDDHAMGCEVVGIPQVVWLGEGVLVLWETLRFAQSDRSGAKAWISSGVPIWRATLRRGRVGKRTRRSASLHPANQENAG